MSILTERIEELLELAQEFDLPTLRALDYNLHALLEQREAAQERNNSGLSASEEFHQRHPHILVDPDLFALVGTHPENPIEEDKLLIREEITRKFSQ
jgi:hypothetical protein